MQIELLKARLIDQAVFARVQGAAQLASALERRQFSAEAYVVLTSAKPDGNSLINAVEQRITETYSVLFWKTVANDATGDKTLDLVEATRELVIAAILGWSPDADHSPMLYAGGQLNRFDGGAVLWEDSFSTQSYMRAGT